MASQFVRSGEHSPDFTLPRVIESGSVSLTDYRGKQAVLLGLFRGLHCPFCRRQIFQLSGMHDMLRERGVVALAVVNTLRERAAVYFRVHPVRVVLLADPDARTHARFGVPSVVPDDAFAAVRSDPTGELGRPMHPMDANRILNARDGFVTTPTDDAIFAAHGAQLSAHLLIDRDGVVRWSIFEAERGIADVARMPGQAEILSAVRGLDP
jgi:peroxiredoxin